MTKPKAKSPKKAPSVKKDRTTPLFESDYWEKTKRASGKTSTKGQERQYENPVQEIVTKPEWIGSCEVDVRDFAIQLLTGYLWACKYQPNFMASHREHHKCEDVLYRLSWLKLKDEAEEWVPDEDEMLQLALIDFVRVLPKMWD